LEADEERKNKSIQFRVTTLTEETLFAAALEKATPADRAAFLDEACAGDASMRRRVDALLWSHENAEFLNTPAVELDGIAPGETSVAATEVAVGPSADPMLDFLAPSRTPGSLGRLDHYEVHEVIGHGGMGVVLRAFDERLHRVVAIKVMAARLATSATARRRFTREAQAAAAVSHDHVVTIHAVEEADGLPYLVMQYVAGMSLQGRLESEGPLQLAEILRIGLQTAAGLAAAHAQGLVHRDIKPANILLENGVERVKITDFGLARAVDDASLTQSGVVAGTPQYMSPEQAEGKVVDRRTDLFSLGSVLYAMCTGRAPFRGCGTMAVLKRVCEDAPSPVREANPEIPDSLVAIIGKLHAKDPAERYQTAGEVAEILGQYLAHMQHPSVVPVPPTEKQARLSKFGRRNRWATFAAGLLCLAAGAGISEGTGVTQLASTVIRVLTPDGTLVVNVNDPGVKVTIEGDGGLVINGAGPQNVRLRPGRYQVRATKDGKALPVDHELVTITRSDRQIVSIRLERDSATAAAGVGPGAFVLPGTDGVPERKFDSLAEAIMTVGDGGTIELRGNGPFVTEPVTVADRRALMIRAGDGFRPVIQLAAGLGEDYPHMLSTNGALVLEGLEIRCERRPGAQSSLGFSAVIASGGRLLVTNCRFVAPFRQSLNAPDSFRTFVSNCEFLGSPGWSDALTGVHPPGGVWELENCVKVGGTMVSCGINSPNAANRTTRIRRCSLVSCSPLFCHFYRTPKVLGSGQNATLLRVDVSGTLIDLSKVVHASWSLASLDESHAFNSAAAEAAIRRLLDWRGADNVHHRLGHGTPGPAEAMITWGVDQPGAASGQVFEIDNLARWRKFWHSAETRSIDGEIRYQGGDLAGRLASGAAKLTPKDFRLRPDSAGYRAGVDSKDLGADVDLVGPGPAYERWKKTPSYQQWLKETAQTRLAATPEPDAFVVIGGTGVEERTLRTLADAVLSASDGDTIELRGNGPFVTDPVTISDRRALTIRAGKGFRPVLQLTPGLDEDHPHLLSTCGPLILEGLEIRCQRLPTAKSSMGFSGIAAIGGVLRVANCRFVTPLRHAIYAPSSHRAIVRNCEFLSSREWSDGLTGACATAGNWELENCVQVGGALVSCGAFTRDERNATVRIRRCSLIACLPLFCYFHTTPRDPDSGRTATLVRAEVTESLIDSGPLLGLHRNPGFLDKGNPLHDAAAEDAIPRLVTWRGTKNVHHRLGNGPPIPGDAMIWWGSLTGAEPVASVDDLAKWRKFWGSPETGSIQSEIRYRGGDLAGRLFVGGETLTPEDFRLRPDSAGYRARSDGKDLGAEIDLVGPGVAYARWKKTPEYEMWLKEIGQVPVR
jgi:Protein kinase domain